MTLKIGFVGDAGGERKFFAVAFSVEVLIVLFAIGLTTNQKDMPGLTYSHKKLSL